MAEPTWRDVWSPFRVAWVDETAHCLAEQQSAATAGERPRWNEMDSVQQDNLAENIARIFLAQDQAMHELAKRGIPF
jgi:hypothetical protein